MNNIAPLVILTEAQLTTIIAEATALGVKEGAKMIASAPPDPLLTRDEAAALLKVQPRTIDNRRKDGRLTAYVSDGIVRFKQSEVIASLQKEG